MALLNHWSNFILLQPAQQWALSAAGKSSQRIGANLAPGFAIFAGHQPSGARCVNPLAV